MIISEGTREFCLFMHMLEMPRFKKKSIKVFTITLAIFIGLEVLLLGIGTLFGYWYETFLVVMPLAGLASMFILLGCTEKLRLRLGRYQLHLLKQK